MAIVFNQEVNIPWSAKGLAHYKKLGFQLLQGQTIKVPIKYVLPNSNALIKCQCDYCGEFFDREYNIITKSTNKTMLCTKECYREWYANVWSQRKSWKEESRKRAVKILESGSISKTDSEAQLMVNEILDKLKINYTNEYGFEVVAVDNFLVDYGLVIEVMGTYWHCDPRVYDTIKYQMQFDRIKNDKRKRMIIKSLQDINVLYLWEKDLKENKEVCISLIKEYVDKQGELDNYHSFNYNINNKKFALNKSIIKSYFECDINYLKSIFIPTDGKKKSYKQLDKWITFNCDYCGEETEQLKSRYTKNKNHHCSQECKKVSQLIGGTKELGGVLYDCDFCGKEFKAKNYLYNALKTGKRKSLFCSSECYNKQQRRDGVDSDSNGNPYDEDFLIKEFYRFRNENGRYPRISDFTNNSNFPNVKIYKIKWGSWRKFVDSLEILGNNGWYKEDEEIIRKYYPENDIQSIIENITVSVKESSIRKHAQRLGLSVKSKLEKINKQEFIDNYKNKKMSTKELAKLYNCSDSLILAYIKDNNIEFNEGFWTEEKTALLLDIYQDSDWGTLLKAFSPLKKGAIKGKARRMNLKRQR